MILSAMIGFCLGVGFCVVVQNNNNGGGFGW